MEDGLIYEIRCEHKVYKIIFRKERRGTQKIKEERDRERERDRHIEKESFTARDRERETACKGKKNP